MPDIDESVRKNMAAMLGRPAPDEAVTKEAIRKQSVGPLMRPEGLLCQG